jgi:hypothetical protein
MNSPNDFVDQTDNDTVNHKLFSHVYWPTILFKNRTRCSDCVMKGYGVATQAQNKIFPAKQELLL